MVQSCTEDALYTLTEMQRADTMLQKVFDRAGTKNLYRGMFYPGGDKFDRATQEDAFV